MLTEYTNRFQETMRLTIFSKVDENTSLLLNDFSLGAVIWNPVTSYDEMMSFRNSSVWCPNGQYFLAHMPYFKI